MSPELVDQATDFLARNLSGSPSGHADAVTLAVVGDLALDRFVFGNVDRISPEAPVPLLHVDKSVDKPGCAANVAWNVATLTQALPNFRLVVLGVIGADETGQQLSALLSELGAGPQVNASAPSTSTSSLASLGAPSRVEVQALRDASRPTTLKMRYLAGTQHQLLRVDVENSSPCAEPVLAQMRERFAAILPRCRSVIFQDYAKGLFTKDFLQGCLRDARAANVFTLVDPHRSVPLENYRHAALFKPNVIEAEILLGRNLRRGEDDELMAAACREFKDRLDLKMALITRGRYGLTLLDADDRITHLPALARAVFDVTGAGDTVIATLATCLARGATLPVACAVAIAAAAVVVGKVGTATATPQEIAAELGRLV